MPTWRTWSLFHIRPAPGGEGGILLSTAWPGWGGAQGGPGSQLLPGTPEPSAHVAERTEHRGAGLPLGAGAKATPDRPVPVPPGG